MNAKLSLFLTCLLITAPALPLHGQGESGQASNHAQPSAPATQPASTQPSRAADADDAEAAEQTVEFAGAASSLQQRLERSLKELSDLRERITEQKLPLSRKLRELESDLAEVRDEFQEKSRVLDSRSLDVSNLNTELKSRKEEARYLSNLLTDYIRNFETRLHIAELTRYEQPLESAKLAPENSNLSQQQVYERQASMVETSIGRLEEALGGMRFEGSAADAAGTVEDGTFVLMGPAALFGSANGRIAGTAEQSLNAATPTVQPLKDPEDTAAAKALVAGKGGRLPLDPTLGKAHKIEATQSTFMEYVEQGGPVMVPIFALAGISLLVALYKWVALMLLRKPSERKIKALLSAVAANDHAKVKERVAAMKGPAGRMLAAGVEHLREPRELIEEVMYEHVLSTRLKVQRMLPFIAITASASPLLGLLGTVTGIINTFELITAFGTGDVQALSGGISEALVTTMFGLIVAIPSLLLYAFLSRKARRVTDQMEKAALAFANEVAKARSREENQPQPQAQPQPAQTQAAQQNKQAQANQDSQGETGEKQDDAEQTGQSTEPAESSSS